MKVLIACECSGITREAFRRRGHDAWSCDIKPSNDGSRYHIQANVLDIIGNGWDFMLAHPPCTDLAVSGAWLFDRKTASQRRAVAFFLALYNAPIRKVAIENPIGIMSTVFRKPDQIIDPFLFGHKYTKKTCLWLKNLPHLTIPSMLKVPILEGTSGNPRNFAHTISGDDPNAGAKRSVSFPNIAYAMAEQWG